MADDTRQGQDALCFAIREAVERVRREWDLTTIDLVGTLHHLADRYSHDVMHDDDDEEAR